MTPKSTKLDEFINKYPKKENAIKARFYIDDYLQCNFYTDDDVLKVMKKVSFIVSNIDSSLSGFVSSNIKTPRDGKLVKNKINAICVP